MRLIRALGIAWVIAEFFLTPSMGLVQSHAQSAQFQAFPYPIPYIVPQQCQVPGACSDLNAVVQQLDQFFGPYFPQPSGTIANVPTFNPSAAGLPVILGASGTDANINIALSPKGNGDVVLFYGNVAATGLLSFANVSSWVAGNGVDRCPGSVGSSQYSASPFGGSVPGLTTTGTTVTGYIPVQDWLGRTHKLVACG